MSTRSSSTSTGRPRGARRIRRPSSIHSPVLSCPVLLFGSTSPRGVERDPFPSLAPLPRRPLPGSATNSPVFFFSLHLRRGATVYSKGGLSASSGAIRGVLHLYTSTTPPIYTSLSLDICGAETTGTRRPCATPTLQALLPRARIAPQRRRVPARPVRRLGREAVVVHEARRLSYTHTTRAQREREREKHRPESDGRARISDASDAAQRPPARRGQVQPRGPEGDLSTSGLGDWRGAFEL
ncbi:hypothetical protein GGS23DRAFT_529451 [Durotheca rogersii]|uniref:uncharacterized protein n=1 Tax=Durotheca rogersii TaxID=419775 RepID=UPI00221FDEEB|nr:uncharacterized protein GGS23DRAFT_529451 [Durotheca rogersii]KAI5863364.1 hypothetical protein GGS23DRAFT_529451 [Durotheca rogersii]